ncbi:hypothetical protein HDU98_000990 [Podochytrium sp. JEL0797]|nr:hypothetical protein HDU98_000990 [Podochytrium sp. JEL0797]
MNAIIIVAATSAANSSIYACSRTLLRLAQDGSAPKLFGKVDKRGVPVNSVAAVAFVGLLAVVAAYASGPDGSVNVFNWLAGVISYGIMAAWMIMSFTHLRFRAGYLAQGRKVEDLPYIAPFYPYSDYLSITIGSIITCFMLVSAFYPNGVATSDFFNLNWWMNNSWTYCGVPVTILFYFGYGMVKPGSLKMVPLMEMDFETGKFYESEEEKVANDHIHERPKNMAEWGQRIWFKLF